jgi:hypothetical protein
MSGHDIMMIVSCRPVNCKEEDDFYLNRSVDTVQRQFGL